MSDRALKIATLICAILFVAGVIGTARCDHPAAAQCGGRGQPPCPPGTPTPTPTPPGPTPTPRPTPPGPTPTPGGASPWTFWVPGEWVTRGPDGMVWINGRPLQVCICPGPCYFVPYAAPTAAPGHFAPIPTLKRRTA